MDSKQKSYLIVIRPRTAYKHHKFVHQNLALGKTGAPKFSMPILDHKTLRLFATQILQAVETPSETANCVADHLVDANLAGHDSHGVIRLPQYCAHVREGKVLPTAKATVVQETPTTAVVDGQHGWGPGTAIFATRLAIEKATAVGLAAVLVRRAYHVGRVGVYPTLAADQGLIGITYCNVQGASRMAPWGSSARRLSTNPIAFAVPTSDQPIVVDFASSAVAEGKVRLALNSGKSVPLGWVTAPDGTFSSNPKDVYENGALALLGGQQGHKGYGLAVAMDLLTGVLAGTGTSDMVDFYANSLLIQVIDPKCFCDPDEFRSNLEAYRQHVLSAPPIGETPVMMPGDPERKTRVHRLRHGIQIDEGVWGHLRKLADELKVSIE